MAIILDGKKLSEKILGDLKEKIKKSGKRLKLAAVLVGENRNSKIFLRQKEKACERVGINFKLYKFEEGISQESLMDEVDRICQDPENHGIIIQLPLPENINTQEILNLIPPKKDVDALSDRTSDILVLSPVLEGILELFREYNIEIKDKYIVVVGKGRLVGRPIISWLKEQGEKFTVIDKSTPNISRFTKEADILISGAGQSGLIKGNMVKRGVVVVDAAGDVDFESCAPKASYITPVPGGLGPMTVAEVIKNLVILNT
jgi:methylenetetrahydrofolate dehydrogenase (NADP+)/methenyltetrahydrofolate cyclohydrolase